MIRPFWYKPECMLSHPPLVRLDTLHATHWTSQIGPFTFEVLINCPLGSLRSPQRALPTETKVESGTSQSKSGTSVNLSNRKELRGTKTSYQPAFRTDVRPSIYDKCWGSMKITTHLDHICHLTAPPGTNWSNRWTKRVFMINTGRN